MSASPSAGATSFRRNLVANYLGQLYSGAIGLLMVPVYLRHFGAETYGLIGFFGLLQASAQMLDLGLSAAVARETARWRGGQLDTRSFRRVLRVFEWLFWIPGLLLALAIAWQAGGISRQWLAAQQLAPLEVERSLQFIAVAVALRWVATLYRGVLIGLERQLWLNGFLALIATLRFVAAVPVALMLDGSVVAFFAFQVLVSAVELGGLARVSLRAAPAERVRAAGAWRLALPALRFAASAGVATIVWIAVTQVDRLVLSVLLPLAEYGWFTAAVGAAGVIAILTMALAQALAPRLTALAHESSPERLHHTYRQATQLSTALGVPLTFTLLLLPRELLWAWTGDPAFADRYAGVLALYAAGNGFLLVAGLPYCLQYALGRLRLHVIGNLLLGATAIPALLVVAPAYGAVGTGWVWAILNAAWFALWTPVVHRRFAPGLHARWLLRDIGCVAVPAAVLALLLHIAGLPDFRDRWLSVLVIGGVFTALLVASMLATDAAWAALRSRGRRAATR